MNQSTHIKIPSPLHAQLKALAAARGTTMTAVIHDAVRQAIEAGELPDETPGLKATLHLDMDAEHADEQGPFVRVVTPKGDLPNMTRDDALAIARRLDEVQPGDEIVRHRINMGGQWRVSFVGTSVELWGEPWDSQNAVSVKMTTAGARDFARQLRKVAENAVPDSE